jgi:hypothetical protein
MSPTRIPGSHPSSVEEAVAHVVSCIPDGDKAAIISKRRDDFALAEHFGLGMGIRNSLYYRNRNRQSLEEDCKRALGGQPGTWMPLHEDDVSRVVLEAVWEQLRAAAKE